MRPGVKESARRRRARSKPAKRRPGVNERWLVAAWPGAGDVATTAAVYLLSRLRMHQIAEFSGRNLFEPEAVEVQGGVVQAPRLPRSRLFLWRRPRAVGPDLLVFLGDAQPAVGKTALCDRLLEMSRKLRVRRVFSIAASVSAMDPRSPSRTFGIAADPASLDELRRNGVPIHSDGQIGGLNGLLLAAAGEAGLPAVGLLGETPSLAVHLPYASAAASVLRIFTRLAHVDLDLRDLEDYGRSLQEQFSKLYAQLQQTVAAGGEAGSPPETGPSEAAAPPARDEDSRRIERLFASAKNNREKAFELKKELDLLGRFREYEDRFLDLFEHQEP